jgi:hypothetical protein
MRPKDGIAAIERKLAQLKKQKKQASNTGPSVYIVCALAALLAGVFGVLPLTSDGVNLDANSDSSIPEVSPRTDDVAEKYISALRQRMEEAISANRQITYAQVSIQLVENLFKFR